MPPAALPVRGEGESSGYHREEFDLILCICLLQTPSNLPPPSTYLSDGLDPERSVELQFLVQELPRPHGEKEGGLTGHGLHTAVPAGEDSSLLAEPHHHAVEPEVSEDDDDLLRRV